jgi:pimeloyl-ACP methyl ester carboxylesterase
LDMIKNKIFLVLLVAPLFFVGCQASDMVLVRTPDTRMYKDPQDVSPTAKKYWEFAVLSENVYPHKRGTRRAWEAQELNTPDLYQQAFEQSCVPGRKSFLPLKGWEPWENFPDTSLNEQAKTKGFHAEVWEKVGSSPPLIVVAFRGTEASWLDWQSNLRWILRFVPFYTTENDQYGFIAKVFGNKFLEELKKKNKGSSVNLIAVGHSLGGGLAQHFAYSLPEGVNSSGVMISRVSKVYAFDPSPVTGWYSIDGTLRESNAKDLKIDRIFEHGEALAYIRLLLSYLNPPSLIRPAMQEIRYNFVPSLNPFSSHSMTYLACALSHFGGQVHIPDFPKKFGYEQSF